MAESPRNHQRQLTHTAYHEAGHAVMSYPVRRRILHVTIVPNPTEDTLGHCAHDELHAFHPDRPGDRRTWDTCE